MFQIERMRRSGGEVIRQNSMGELEYLTFPAFENTGLVEHLFSTRMGGVSEGIFSTMNLSFTRGDDSERVLTNYRRLESILHCRTEDMVASQQTHTTNIRQVEKQDRGKGIVRALDYENVDGLITDQKGIALVTYFADCVPLFFLDPVNGAIGLAHSGWRGTVNEMGRHMMEAMGASFGSRPENMLAAIGPSICRDCYEVGGEVAEEFQTLWENGREFIEEIRESGKITAAGRELPKVLVPGRKPGKYRLDLWLANLLILRKAGIPLAGISVTDICTCHNPQYLFSHRASNGKRGNLAAFLMLKKS